MEEKGLVVLRPRTANHCVVVVPSKTLPSNESSFVCGSTIISIRIYFVGDTNPPLAVCLLP